MHRCGKLPDFCDGIQAHLSTCASPRVIEVASKLPQNISLKEVPRLSTWPSQFHDCGVKEDNIALYFFARDIHRFHFSIFLSLIFPLVFFSCQSLYFSVNLMACYAVMKETTEAYWII